MVTRIVSEFLFRSASRRTVTPHDDDIAQYATTTYRDGEVVARTPQVTFGQLRRSAA